MRPDTNAIGSSAAMTVKVARIVGPPTSSTRDRDDLGDRALVDGEVPVDVLDDDDCVIDQDADRKDQREQRDPVDREAPRPGGKQRRRPASR